jgi:4-hydroxyphenylpyruvate dioxygenase
VSALAPLGILRVEALHYYVHDLERSRRFYTERLDFAEVAASGPELERDGRQRSAVFEAGDVRIVCSEPLGEGGRAWRWLRKHPDGVGTVVFAVEDADRCFRLLEERGATPITDVQEHRDDGGTLRAFNITTPLGDTTFRFVERRGALAPYPGMVRHPSPRGGRNAFGFGFVDHLTSNFQTMKPALLWMEHVLGLEEFWEVQFHTDEAGGPKKPAPPGPSRGSGQPHPAAPALANAAEARRAALEAQKGSGLRSVVMRDPVSGVKFANNEPWRPAFKSSQINVFHEDHRGDGIQHAALSVKDILSAVRGMRARGVEFMPTPPAYYDALPERLRTSGIGRIDEDLATLRELEILVDGASPGAYLLQIFLRDSAGLYREPEAGPFFFEIIQRKGDQGFGAGNFRALFESIEREQQREGRT